MAKVSWSILIVVEVLLVFAVVPASAQWVRQTIPLEPGWNAVFLEVQPSPAQCDLQLQSLPVLSVWAYDPRFSAVEFVQDPSELSPDIPAWRVYFPPGHPQSALTNLFILQAGMTYLIHTSSQATWTVVGQPVLARQRWKPDGYNLVGFWVNPDNPPTFASWFAHSSAHSPLDVWALGASGQWARVDNPSSRQIQSGQAYWVYCHGVSEYQGPVEVRLGEGTHLDYARTLVEHQVEVARGGLAAKTITLSSFASQSPPAASLPSVAGEVPLTYYRQIVQGETASFGYEPLPATLTFAAAEAHPKSVRLAVERAGMSPSAGEGVYQSILEIKDDAGFRRLIGVESQGRASSAASAKPGRLLQVTPNPFAGLWVGTVTLDRISELNREWDVLSRTPTEFSFRVIFHVDSEGAVRLLNEVTQLWRAGTYAPDPENPALEVVDQPGWFVLLTPTAPQSLLDEIGATLQAGTLRDGRPFARRFSTAAYSLMDAQGNSEEPQMEQSGAFGVAGSVLSATLVMEDSDPLNPFHHQYHPQHKYPEPEATPYPRNDWTIGWHMAFTFSSEPPDAIVLPGWGDTQLGGTFEEQLRGLKSEPIRAQGTFRLQRASTVSALNDEDEVDS